MTKIKIIIASTLVAFVFSMLQDIQGTESLVTLPETLNKSKLQGVERGRVDEEEFKGAVVESEKRIEQEKGVLGDKGIETVRQHVKDLQTYHRLTWGYLLTILEAMDVYYESNNNSELKKIGLGKLYEIKEERYGEFQEQMEEVWQLSWSRLKGYISLVSAKTMAEEHEELREPWIGLLNEYILSSSCNHS